MLYSVLKKKNEDELLLWPSYMQQPTRAQSQEQLSGLLARQEDSSDLPMEIRQQQLLGWEAGKM